MRPGIHVLISFFMVTGLKSGGLYGASAPATPFNVDAALKLEETLIRAIDAYNAVDQKHFTAEFSSTAPGFEDPAAVRRLFFGYYLPEFGRLMTKRMLPKESDPDPDRGMLVYDAAFDKVPKARLSANFRRENGMIKLVQIRIEKVDK